jgi:hypothetical protein
VGRIYGRATAWEGSWKKYPKPSIRRPSYPERVTAKNSDKLTRYPSSASWHGWLKHSISLWHGLYSTVVLTSGIISMTSSMSSHGAKMQWTLLAQGSLEKGGLHLFIERWRRMPSHASSDARVKLDIDISSCNHNGSLVADGTQPGSAGGGSDNVHSLVVIRNIHRR